MWWLFCHTAGLLFFPLFFCFSSFSLFPLLIHMKSMCVSEWSVWPSRWQQLDVACGPGSVRPGQMLLGEPYVANCPNGQDSQLHQLLRTSHRAKISRGFFISALAAGLDWSFFSGACLYRCVCVCVCMMRIMPSFVIAGLKVGWKCGFGLFAYSPMSTLLIRMIFLLALGGRGAGDKGLSSVSRLFLSIIQSFIVWDA